MVESALKLKQELDEKIFQPLESYYARPKELTELSSYNPFIRYMHYIWYRIHALKWNELDCVVGQVRTGKSVFACFKSYLMNSKFMLEKDVVYNHKNFSRRIQEINSIGETVIWDEAGVGLPARDFWRIQNKEIGKMLQTAGHLRPMITFVTPDFSYIDTQPKKMFHRFYEVYSRTEKYSNIKMYSIIIDRRHGKFFFKYPRFSYNGIYRITNLKFFKPPLAFIDQYENFSNPAKIELRSKSISLINANENKFDVETIKKYIMDNQSEFLTTKGKLDPDLIFDRFRQHFATTGNPSLQARSIAKAVQMVLQKENKPVEVEPKIKIEHEEVDEDVIE